MGSFTLRDPNDIGVAVLGAGRMGQTHIATIAAINRTMSGVFTSSLRERR